MRVTIVLDCDGAAFEDEPIAELTRILGTVPAKLTRILARTPGCVCTAPEADDKLLDSYGRTVGSLTVSED